MTGLQPTLLIPVGRTLLLGSFGVTLINAMRGKHDLALPFERLVLAFLALTFFDIGAFQLEAMGDLLTAMILKLGQKDDLRALLTDAFKQAAASPTADGGSTSFNLPAVIEQAWRTGVWGVMTATVEGTFLVVSFVLECMQEVLWKLLLFLFPIAAGMLPVFPRMLSNLVIYAVELTLWFPMLCLIEFVTGTVAKEHLTQSGSLGLFIVGVEIVAILLILLIPTVTHRFLSGAISGDFNSQSGVFVMVRKVVSPVKGGPR
jgi:hypothetical protein